VPANKGSSPTLKHSVPAASRTILLVYMLFFLQFKEYLHLLFFISKPKALVVPLVKFPKSHLILPLQRELSMRPSSSSPPVIPSILDFDALPLQILPPLSSRHGIRRLGNKPPLSKKYQRVCPYTTSLN
jgi:hypothetical protein